MDRRLRYIVIGVCNSKALVMKNIYIYILQHRSHRTELHRNCYLFYYFIFFSCLYFEVFSAFQLRDVNPEIFAEPTLLIDAGFIDIESQYIRWYICGGTDATITEWSTKVCRIL